MGHEEAQERTKNEPSFLDCFCDFSCLFVAKLFGDPGGSLLVVRRTQGSELVEGRRPHARPMPIDGPRRGTRTHKKRTVSSVDCFCDFSCLFVAKPARGFRRVVACRSTGSRPRACRRATTSDARSARGPTLHGTEAKTSMIGYLAGSMQWRWSDLTPRRWFGAASPQRAGVSAFHLSRHATAEGVLNPTA
jgi:hypothetical protein